MPLESTDLLLINRGGKDYKITVKDLYNYVNQFPWQDHEGGIFHIILDDPNDINFDPESVVHFIDLATGQELDVIGHPGEFIILTKTNASSAFAESPGSWQNGPLTNTSRVTNMEKLFYRCENFNSDLSNFDVSNVTDMSFMFTEAYVFNGDITGWDVSNVTTMEGMFNNASDFNQDISSWDVGNVQDMEFMFNSTAFNQDIGGWDVSNVKWMTYMFGYTPAFNQDISGWQLSNCITTSGMFKGSQAFNQDISKWDMSDVNNTSSMFEKAEAFNQDIGVWDVSNVKNVRAMFSATEVFNQDISGWDVGNVTDMNQMFKLAKVFNQDLSTWCVTQFSTKPDNFDDGADAWTKPRPVWGTCPPPAPGDPTEYECTHTNTPVGSWGTGGLGVLTFKDESGNVFTQDNFYPSDWSGDPERIFTQTGYSKDDADVWHAQIMTATEPPILEWIPRSTLVGNKLEFAYLAHGSEFEVIINGESQGKFTYSKDNVELLEFTIPDGKFKSLEIKNMQKGYYVQYGDGYFMSIGNIFIDDHNVQTPRQNGKVHLVFPEDARDEIAELVASPSFKGGSQVMGADHGEHRFDIMTTDVTNLTVVLNHSDDYGMWNNPSTWWLPKD